MGSGRCTFVLDGPDDHLASRVVQLSHRHFRAVPDGALLTVESSMRNVLPVNMWGISMGLHVRCGIEDNLWNQARTAKFSTVEHRVFCVSTPEDRQWHIYARASRILLSDGYTVATRNHLGH